MRNPQQQALQFFPLPYRPCTLATNIYLFNHVAVQYQSSSINYHVRISNQFILRKLKAYQFTIQ